MILDLGVITPNRVIAHECARVVGYELGLQQSVEVIRA